MDAGNYGLSPWHPKYSFYGHRGKLCYRSASVYELLVRSVKFCCSYSTGFDHVVEEAMKSFLKHAKGNEKKH